jgi:hypothetical protein
LGLWESRVFQEKPFYGKIFKTMGGDDVEEKV